MKGFGLLQGGKDECSPKNGQQYTVSVTTAITATSSVLIY